VKTAADAVGTFVARRRRATLAKRRMAGAAEGTIIATIITTHIGISQPSWGAPASPDIGIAIAAWGDIARPVWMM
jgi:hypothetical protein